MTVGNTRVGFLAIGVVSLSVRSAARRYAKSPLMRSNNPMGSLGTAWLHVIRPVNRPPAIAVRQLRSGRSGQSGKSRKAVKGRGRRTDERIVHKRGAVGSVRRHVGGVLSPGRFAYGETGTLIRHQRVTESDPEQTVVPNWPAVPPACAA